MEEKQKAAVLKAAEVQPEEEDIDFSLFYAPVEPEAVEISEAEKRRAEKAALSVDERMARLKLRAEAHEARRRARKEGQ
jgi:hypothetical protein